MSKLVRVASRRPFRCAIVAAIAAGPIAISSQVTWGQSSPEPLTAISAADIKRVVEGGGAQQIRVVDFGKYNVAVSVVRRGPTKPGAPLGALRHEKVSEIFYVLSGSATLIVGDEVVDVKPQAADSFVVRIFEGPGHNGTFKQPAMSRKLSAGDVALVPAGVWHNFIDIVDHLEYLMIKPDPEKVLPAGYVNPALTK